MRCGGAELPTLWVPTSPLPHMHPLLLGFMASLRRGGWLIIARWWPTATGVAWTKSCHLLTSWLVFLVTRPLRGSQGTHQEWPHPNKDTAVTQEITKN